MAGNGDDGTPPTTPKAGGTGYGSLTAREGEIMAKAMVCLKTAPEIDYEKLAHEVGMTNPRSASNAWSAIKKKMNWTLKAGEGTPATGKSGKSGASAKRKKSAADNDDSDEAEQATPTKKPKASASKPRKKAAATPKKGKTPKSAVVAKDDSEEEDVKSANEEAALPVKEEAEVEGEV